MQAPPMNIPRRPPPRGGRGPRAPRPGGRRIPPGMNPRPGGGGYGGQGIASLMPGSGGTGVGSPRPGGGGYGGRRIPPGIDPRPGPRPPPRRQPPRRQPPMGGRNIGPPGRGRPPMMQGGGVPPEMGPPPEMAMGPPPEMAMGPPPPALDSPASPLGMLRGADPMGGPPMGRGEGAPGEGVEELPTAIADTLLLNTASPDEALAILDQAREEILAQMMPEDPGMDSGRLDALADPMMMG